MMGTKQLVKKGRKKLLNYGSCSSLKLQVTIQDEREKK